LLKLMPISKVLNDEALGSTVVRIQQRSIIFENLRDAMRIASVLQQCLNKASPINTIISKLKVSTPS